MSCPYSRNRLSDSLNRFRGLCRRWFVLLRLRLPSAFAVQQIRETFRFGSEVSMSTSFAMKGN